MFVFFWIASVLSRPIQAIAESAFVRKKCGRMGRLKSNLNFTIGNAIEIHWLSSLYDCVLEIGLQFYRHGVKNRLAMCLPSF